MQDAVTFFLLQRLFYAMKGDISEIFEFLAEIVK